MDVGSLISGSSAFSKTSLNIWKFKVHILLKTSLENFEHYFASVWDECNCAVVWAFLGLPFLWDWKKTMLWKLTFFSPVATAEFSKFAGILSAALSQHHLTHMYIHKMTQLYIHIYILHTCSFLGVLFTLFFPSRGFLWYFIQKVF